MHVKYEWISNFWKFGSVNRFMVFQSYALVPSPPVMDDISLDVAQIKGRVLLIREI